MRPSTGHCPRCGKTGCGPFQKTVRGKPYDYFAHPFKGESGWKLRWCYLPKPKREKVEGPRKARAIAELMEARGKWKRYIPYHHRSHNGKGRWHSWGPYGHSDYVRELQETAETLGVTERTIRRWILPRRRIRLDQLEFDDERRRAFKRRMVHVLIEIKRGNTRVLAQKINQDPIGELKDRGWLSHEGNLTEKGLSIMQEPQTCMLQLPWPSDESFPAEEQNTGKLGYG
jgi:hypothetical protein